MDELKRLRELIEAKKQLLAVEENPDRQKELTDEILGLNRDLGRLEAEKRFREQQDAAEREAAKAKSATATAIAEPPPSRPDPGQEVRVGTPGTYRGIFTGSEYQMKREIAHLTSVGSELRKYPEIQEHFRRNPEAAERAVKVWLNLWDRARKRASDPVGLYQTKADLQEDTDSEGGFLVFPEYRDELLFYLRLESVALRRARVVPMASDVAYYPRENATMAVNITAEETTATKSDPTFEQVTLTAKRHDAYTIASNELLNDAGIRGGIVAILISQFNAALGQKIDSVVFTGTGDPMSGIFTAATGNSVVFDTGSTHFSEVLYDDFTEAVGQVPADRRRNAAWYIDRSPLWTYVNTLKDGDSRPLFVAPVSGTPGRILGYPVEEIEEGKDTSAADTALAVLGDLMSVMLGERMSTLDLLIDPYTEGKDYQTVFAFFVRWAYAYALPNNLARVVTASS